MYRSRRGVSELVGSLFVVIIIASLLATVVIVGEEFRGTIRGSVRDASERLIEASNPPELILRVVNNSLVLSVIQRVPIEISSIIVYYLNNGSMLLLNATDDVFDNGQIIVDNYSCEKVRVAVVSSRGNVFYYKYPYYSCGGNLDSELARGVYGISGIEYVIYGANYSSYDVNIIDNIDTTIRIGFNVWVDGNSCRATLTYGGRSSTAATGIEGYRWGPALGSVPIAGGVEVRLAPAVYVWNGMCVAGVEFRYNMPSIVEATVSLTGNMHVDSAFFKDLRTGRVVIAPIIYSQQTTSYVDLLFTVTNQPSGLSLSGSASGFSGTVYISNILVLSVVTLENAEFYEPSIDLDVDISISKLIYINESQRLISYAISGPYKIRLLVPDPYGRGNNMEEALVKTLWVSRASTIMYSVDGRNIRIQEEPVVVNRILSSLDISIRQAIEPQLLSRTWYTIVGTTNTSLLIDLTVSIDRVGAPAAITPPPIIEVESRDGNYLIIAASGHRQPSISQGSSYYITQVIDPGGAQASIARLTVDDGIQVDHTSVYKTRSPTWPTPGFYIANEVYTVSGIKTVSAMVILVP